MCGPTYCLICEPSFLSKVRHDKVTKLWAALWIPLIIFWIIYFSFAIDKMANSELDSSFQVQIRQELPINVPAWTICSLASNDLIRNITCTITGYNSNKPISSININNMCYIFNTDLDPPPVADYTNPSVKNQGKISCFIEMNNVTTGLSKVWVHDPSLKADNASQLQANLDSIPSGICTAVVNNGTHTTIHWKKNRFSYTNGNEVIGYDRMDYDRADDVSFDPTKITAFLSIWPGDYYTWRFKEVDWWTGYDFWYFLGLIGGMSFILLLIHQLFFFSR